MKRIRFGKFEIKEMPELELKDINSVYIGEPHACMCRCSGDYFYPRANRESASKRRGYDVLDYEVNDGKVQKVLAVMRRNAEKGIEVLDSWDGGYVFTLITEGKQYTIYTQSK